MIYNKLELLKKENDAMAELLSFELQGEIRTMVRYVRSKGLGMYETEIFRKDLIGMCHEAVTRGESLEEILDSGSQDFCDRVLENGGKRKAESLFYVIYNYSIMMLYFSLMQIMVHGYRITINISFFMIMLLFLTGSWLGLYVDKYHIRTGWQCFIPYIYSVLLWCSIVSLSIYIRNHYELIPLFTIGWAPFVLIHFALFLILRIAWNQHIERVVQRTMAQT